MGEPKKPETPETESEKRSLSDYVPEKKKADKKKAMTFVIVLAILFVLLLGLNILSSMDLGDKFKGLFGLDTEAETKRPTSILFYVPDYEENILEDPEYLSLNHFITYTENNSTSSLPEDTDFSKYGEGLALLNECLQAAIRGDDEGYNACFTDAYFEENPEITEFTMQRIYDIEIDLLSSTLLYENTPDETMRYEYRVKYKIQKNNGTFRWDFGSDVSKPEIYEIVVPDSTGEAKINSVSQFLR